MPSDGSSGRIVGNGRKSPFVVVVDECVTTGMVARIERELRGLIARAVAVAQYGMRGTKDWRLARKLKAKICRAAREIIILLTRDKHFTEHAEIDASDVQLHVIVFPKRISRADVDGEIGGEVIDLLRNEINKLAAAGI